LTAGLSFNARDAVDIDTPASRARSSRRVLRRLKLGLRSILCLQILLQILLVLRRPGRAWQERLPGGPKNADTP
jgi:hypothetical protein